MTTILGISAFYHDAAAALIVDGEIVAAAQEERFTRKKHDASFPQHAIAYCLREANLTTGDIDYVGFYEKPLQTFDRLLETYLAHAPAGFASFAKAMPVWLREKLFIPRRIRKGLDDAYKKRIIFTAHHESHAASAFFPSPFEEAAIVTMDGVGEWSSTTIGVGRGNRISLKHEMRFPHSLGLLYSAFTYFCGFRVNSGEYKLMGLAPYGEPRYAQLMLDRLIDLKADGSFRLDQSYFNYCTGLTMTSKKMEKLFDGAPRKPESEITQREMDIAASIQKVTEEIMLRCARTARERTGLDKLCLAGGVALNCVGNGRILREGPFSDIWVQPAAGDAGGALGVALFILHQLLDTPRVPKRLSAQGASALGPGYSESEVKSFLDRVGARYRHFDDEGALSEHVAELLDSENVIGWVQARMEFGPRALGFRSILGDARSPEMQSKMNLKIKFRESFRPFAPVCLLDKTPEYFELGAQHESPYMLIVAPVSHNKRLEAPSARGLDALRVQRSELPAVTHVDYSARVQTIDEERNPRMHKLLTAFQKRTGCPVLINTSFNVRGEPIICTPEDAFRCFMATDMDVLVVEKFVLMKGDQSHIDGYNRESHLSRFAGD